MKKFISVIIIGFISLLIYSPAFSNNNCIDIKQIILKTNNQRSNLNKINLINKKLNSPKLRVRKITGLNSVKNNKVLTLQTKISILKLVTDEKNKMGIVKRYHRSIRNNAADLRNNINLIGKEIIKLTAKWKKQKLLKNRKHCLLAMQSQFEQLKIALKKINLIPFSFNRSNTLDLTRLISQGTSGKAHDSKYKSDEAKLQQKRWEEMEAIADAEIDEAKNNYEEAKEQFKLALRILNEHMERQTQVIQKITS